MGVLGWTAVSFWIGIGQTFLPNTVFSSQSIQTSVRPVQSISQVTNSQANDSQANDSQIVDSQSANYAEAEAEIVRLLDAGRLAYFAADDALSIAQYQQALSLIESVEAAEGEIDIWLKGEALYGFGRAHGQLQNYEVALPALEEALAIFEAPPDGSSRRALSDTEIKIDLYGMLGAIAKDTGAYATALGYARSALELAEVGNRLEEIAIFYHNIGSIEADIGQYAQAIESLRKAAELSEQVGMYDLAASTVFTLGWVAERQNNFEGAIANYQSAIALFSSLRQQGVSEQQGISEQQAEDALKNIISREIRAYNNLGIVYLKQDNTESAKGAFERGFDLLVQSEDSVERALLIDSVGSLHKAKGEIEHAWSSYLKAWRLSQQSNDTAGEIAVLLNLGELMRTQEEHALAIFFYKQAIVQLEAIRSDLQQLSQSVQQRYTRSVESAYRMLADLLLQAGREAEALEILDLLKLQEVRTYLHSEGDERRARAQQFNNAAEADLLAVLKAISIEIPLADFIVHPAAIALQTAAGAQPTEDIFSLQAVNALKQAVAQQPNRTAALYPFILEDRLEILLLTPAGMVERFTTDVSQAQLSETIGDLQKALRNKAFDAQPAAQRLHQWLIEPLSDILSAQGVETIIYLPDGDLRYVPLAALHNGNRWLAEIYQSHTITAAAVDDLMAQREAPLDVMVGAFTDSSVVHEVRVGDRAFAYPGLSAAQQEVDSLMRSLPDSSVLLNQAFSPEGVLAGIENRSILHLATHAQFIPGEPEDSFILFGDGDTVNLRGLQQWRLPTVDLVVLSACQTASSTEGDGKEILGLGYQIQATGAKAAIASLWSVDDTATAALMSQFYKHLSAGSPKADALRLAQVDLLNTPAFSNPYDWAGFILIGNGL